MGRVGIIVLLARSTPRHVSRDEQAKHHGIMHSDRKQDRGSLPRKTNSHALLIQNLHECTSCGPQVDQNCSFTVHISKLEQDEPIYILGHTDYNYESRTGPLSCFASTNLTSVTRSHQKVERFRDSSELQNSNIKFLNFTASQNGSKKENR